MNHSIQFQSINTEPSLAEQLVASTVLGLKQLGEIFGYEFEETIYQIEALYRIQNRPVYRTEDEEYTDPSAFMDSKTLDELAFAALADNPQAIERAKQQVQALYGEDL